MGGMSRWYTRALALVLLAAIPFAIPVRADETDGQPAPDVTTDSGTVVSAPAEQAAPTGDAPAPNDQPPPEVAARNNIFGLNVARLSQERYIWATSDLVNANGGDWGYITVVWTAEDRDNRNADLNLQVFLDRCFTFHVQPIIRVATRYDPKTDSWTRPDPDEPAKWRAYFERANWPTRRVWVIAGNEPNLGREWGGAVDGGDYARYLGRFLDAFEGSDRFKVVNAPLDASNGTEQPKMQDAYEFLTDMERAVPSVFERLGAWASNPYRVISGGDDLRYTHRAYEAELAFIGRDMPVLITEAGHLETGDELEIARFYRESFEHWSTDPRIVAVTPLFWHPDRGEYWMFELDGRGAMTYRSPTYQMLRTLPRVAGSPYHGPPLANSPSSVVDEDGAADPRPPVARAAQSSSDPSGARGSASGATRAAAARDGESGVRTAGGSSAEADADAEAESDPVEPGETSVSSTVALAPPTQRDPAAGRNSSTTAAAPGERVRVSGTDGLGANVRSSPARGAPTVAQVEDGAPLLAVGPVRVVDGRSWRPVRTAAGIDGWIAAELVTSSGGSGAPAPAASPAPTLPRPAAPQTSAPAGG